MAEKKKGFVARMIEGPERSEDYAFSTLPGNRWELGWDKFRTNSGKMMGLNLLMLVFFLPVIIILFFRSAYIQVFAAQSPFSQNLGLGYPAIGTLVGVEEQIYLYVDRTAFLAIVVSSLLAAVGLSGGMYVMRNIIWSEGVFVGSDFWKGVKKNYFIVLLCTLLYTLLAFFIVISIDYVNLITAMGDGNWVLNVSKVLSYVLLVFTTIAYMYMLTLGVTYKLSFWHLIKNASILTVALLPLNLFFAVFSLILVILSVAGGTLAMLGMMFFILFGLSGAALVWTDYSHWVFDKFINDKVPGAKKNRGIYSKNAEEEAPDFSYEMSSLSRRPIKPITDYEIEIVELPQNFSRADLRRLEESKEAMRRDSDEYVERMLANPETNETVDVDNGENKEKTENKEE